MCNARAVTTPGPLKELIMKILKYPRTRHIEGSRLQHGDMADDMPIAELAGRHLIIEEKLDGANAGLSFDENGQIWLQSRGHMLTGGPRERHFALFKTWAHCHAPRLWEVLGRRYVVYGEWLYAKHTIFYDHLPHYFHEFDVWDRERQIFLSTPARRQLLTGLPIIPVPVLYSGEVSSLEFIQTFVKPSLYKSENWDTALERAMVKTDSRPNYVYKQTELSDLSEGLYIKQEVGDQVIGRYKYVRADFHQAILDSEGHWHDRPILPNQLGDGVDIFAPKLGQLGAYDVTS